MTRVQDAGLLGRSWSCGKSRLVEAEAANHRGSAISGNSTWQSVKERYYHVSNWPSSLLNLAISFLGIYPRQKCLHT